MPDLPKFSHAEPPLVIPRAPDGSAWGQCPECHKRTLHRYRDASDEAVATCHNPFCGFYY